MTRFPRPAAGEGGENPAFARDVLQGLARPAKAIPCTWLYDRQGCDLFEAITGLPEYYLTRTEIAMLDTHLEDMVHPVGRQAVVVELGSGSSRKTPALLRALTAPRAYVPVDIAGDYLREVVARLARVFAGLAIRPVVADFTRPFRLPAGLGASPWPRLGFFPGSTIGNLSPAQASAFLRRLARTLGAGAFLLVGADCTRDPGVLIPAYDDPRGITADFNRNLLARINRELGANFDVGRFTHEARYRSGSGHRPGRVEMHLVSTCRQEATVLGRRFAFAAGESIHTENSHKYSPREFRLLARAAGWLPLRCWQDPQRRFSVHLLRLP